MCHTGGYHVAADHHLQLATTDIEETGYPIRSEVGGILRHVTGACASFYMGTGSA